MPVGYTHTNFEQYVCTLIHIHILIYSHSLSNTYVYYIQENHDESIGETLCSHSLWHGDYHVQDSQSIAVWFYFFMAYCNTKTSKITQFYQKITFWQNSLWSLGNLDKLYPYEGLTILLHFSDAKISREATIFHSEMPCWKAHSLQSTTQARKAPYECNIQI